MSLQLVKLIVLGIGLGLAVGIGVFTFWYGKGYSYMSNDPLACANCHIMNEQYDGWLKSSHKTVATCNDCHTPPDTLGKYTVKAWNGFWHSYYFTVGGFHEPIRITDLNRRVAEQSCRTCHETMVHSITVSESIKAAQEVSCISCHRNVGHMH
ncbi:MAG: cytochrome c nitrite reductase small subunit [Acidobacteria bacterium]|nr:cytochrome c nitrite reductase small subunit [Acidobacteriota bacterium]